MIFLRRVFFITLFFIIAIALCFNLPVFAASNTSNSAIFNSALERVARQDYRGALTDFTQVIERDLDLVGAAYSNRCVINLQLQNNLAAERDCLNALAKNPENIEAYLSLGLSYYHQQKYDKAIANYQEIIQRDPQDYRAYYNRGLVYFDLQDYQRAIADYDLALTSNVLIDPWQKTSIYNDRGIVYLTLKNYDEATSNFNRAIEVQNNNYDAYFNRGCTHHRQQNYLGAIADFTQATRINPDFTQAYVNLAILNHKLGRDSAAFTDIDIALQQYRQKGNTLAYNLTNNLKQKFLYSQRNRIG